MNKELKTIDLRSQLIEGLQELTVPQGTVANYDAASGPIVVDKLINHGTIRISSTKDEINEISISARTTVCDGEIVCDLPKLTIVSTEVDARGGKFSASDRIVLSSESDLALRGGTFESEWLDFITLGALKVHADRIESKVSTTADSVSFGVATGDLTVVQSKIAGDPIWYNRAGNITINPGPTNGDDLYVAATGNITIGPIDTTGGDASKPGRVLLVAGCASITADGSQPPPDNTVMTTCSDCDPIYQQLGVAPGFNGDLTVNGNINAKSRIDGQGRNITINGNINGGIFAFRNDLKVTGTVKVINQVDGSKGAIVCLAENDPSQTQNVTIGGNIDADVEIFTYGQGAVKIGNVSGEKDITIFAGATVDSVPGCGGGGAVVSQTGVSPRVLPIATIQTGNLSGVQRSVSLIASGNISAGTINLKQYNLGPSQLIRSHSVAIYANVGGDISVPVFNAGAGGVNGCGVITNNGVASAFFGGAIAIGNPGGITVTTADIKANSDTISSPGIMLDAGKGELKLDAGLDANGNASARAGFIVLNGGKLTVPGAVTISANDTTTGSSVPPPFIVIGISDIPVPGNLNVQCNSDQGTAVQIGPTGFVTIDWLNNNFKPCKFDPNATGPVAFTGAGNIVIAAKSTNGFVKMLGTPLTFNAGTVNVQATGQQGSISIAYDGQTAQQPSLISTGGKVTLNADNSTSNAGNISISADAINITSAFSIHANALSSGNGGTINVTTNGGDLSAQGGAGSFAIAAKGMGSGMTGGTVNLSSAAAITAKGGSIDVTPTDGSGGSIKAVAATILNLTGVFDASGKGLGAGGNLAFVQSSASQLDLSRAILQADGGVPTSGDNVDITYSSASSLKVKTISAVNPNGVTGGTIHIANLASADLTVVVSGTIDTSASGVLAGSITLMPFDQQSNNAALRVSGSGGFNSILSVAAKSIRVTAAPVVQLGLGELASNAGDINICASQDGTCGVAAVASTRVFKGIGVNPNAGTSTVKLIKSMTINRGLALIRTENIVIETDFSATVAQVSPGVTAYRFICTNLSFGANAFLDAGGPQQVSISALGSPGGNLAISLAGGSASGFKNASTIKFESGGSGSISVTAANQSIFALGTILSGSAIFHAAGGDVALASNVQIGTSDYGQGLTPDNVDFRTTTGNIILNGPVFANSSITADNSLASNPLMIASDLRTLRPAGQGSTIRLLAGTNLDQSTGSLISTNGVLRLTSSFGLVGDPTNRIAFDATQLVLKASVGSAYVEGFGTSTVALLASSAQNTIDVRTSGSITLDNDITTTFGDILIVSLGGKIGSKTANITSGGNVELALRQIPVSPVTGTPPANVTVKPGTGGGQIFWGTPPGLTATGSNSVQANVHNIVFETNGAANGIVLSGGVNIQAN